MYKSMGTETAHVDEWHSHLPGAKNTALKLVKSEVSSYIGVIFLRLSPSSKTGILKSDILLTLNYQVLKCA